MVNDTKRLVKDKRNLVNDKKSNEGIQKANYKRRRCANSGFQAKGFSFYCKVIFFLLAITYDVYHPKRGKGPWSRGHSPGSPSEPTYPLVMSLQRPKVTEDPSAR